LSEIVSWIFITGSRLTINRNGRDADRLCSVVR